MEYMPLTEGVFYILLSVSTPNHGYGIMQMASELSDGRVQIGSGTMYGATNNMMKKGWIIETTSTLPEDKRKRLYQLTAVGREILMEEITRLRQLLHSADLVQTQSITKKEEDIL